jgi:hypothetical protein
MVFGGQHGVVQERLQVFGNDLVENCLLRLVAHESRVTRITDRNPVRRSLPVPDSGLQRAGLIDHPRFAWRATCQLLEAVVARVVRSTAGGEAPVRHGDRHCW